MLPVYCFIFDILQEAFTSADVPTILGSLSSQEVDPDVRDHTHGLQTYLMRLCHVVVSDSERTEILNKLLSRHANVNSQVSYQKCLIHPYTMQKHQLFSMVM